jgi:RinA family phage transcriptional activator
METKIRKATFKHVESEIFGYHDTLKEIDRLKKNILYASSPVDTNGGGRSNLPSDPTGRVATIMLTHRSIVQLELIVNSISEVYTQLPEDKQKFVRLKYWTKPQTLTWDGIARKLNVSNRQAFRWRDEIVYAISEKIGWR